MTLDDTAQHSREDCAYHEASHAVYAHHAADLILGSVTIEGRAHTNLGGVPLSMPVYMSRDERIEAAAMYLAGGYGLHRHHHGSTPQPVPFEAFVSRVKEASRQARVEIGWLTSDAARAYTLIELAATGAADRDKTRRACYAEVCGLALRYVSERWVQIETVAICLLRRGTLESEEVAQLIEGVK